MTRTFPFLLLTVACARAGDVQHGKMLVRDELHCLECHGARGQGGKTARDLADVIVARYSPAALASDLWNHTPAMWEEMSNRVIARPIATDEEWQDVFAYLYWLPFSERPGDIRRGEDVFRSKGCAQCHSVELPSVGTGTGVPTWNMVYDPVALLEEMWKHATAMRGEAREMRTGWKRVSGQNLVDLSAYVQSVQKIQPGEIAGKFTLPDPAEGKAPFEANCGRCHRGTLSLSVRLANKTWMDIGAGMWNHVPTVGPLRDIPSGEMRKILAYAWEQQYAGPMGNAMRGRQKFSAKGCVVCHVDAQGRVASPRPNKTFTAFSMVALGWTPGRVMHASMRAKGVSWPYLSPLDVADLMAFLNARKQL